MSTSIKKNTLAAALLAGLGLAGGAAAYNYGTMATGPLGAVDTPFPSATNDTPAYDPTWVYPGITDLIRPELVAYENVIATDGYTHQMAEDLLFDIQIPDNAVQVTTGYTTRVKLNRSNCVPSGQPYPAPDFTCSDNADGALFDVTAPPTVGNGPNQLELRPDLVLGGWTVEFDAFYEGGRVASIRIIPPAGNTANPGPGEMLRWHRPILTSLDEFVANAYAGNFAAAKVDAEFWMVNATNDSRFVESTKLRRILQAANAVNACATPASSEFDKYIDVADDFDEEQIPKTRFSFDGRLGSATDASGGNFQAEADYDSQTIDLGLVTLGTAGGPQFQFWGNGNPRNGVADGFRTQINAGGGQNWDAFDNLGPDDDVYLVDGSCASGTIVDAGEVSGTTVTFYYNADEAAMVGLATKNLRVCGFVDTDTIIDDHLNHVETEFYRMGMYPANGSFPGDPLTGWPTAGYGPANTGSKLYPDVNAAGQHCDLLPLRYNGSTMEIFSLNRASNTSQRTFLRLTNRSTTSGWVRLEGITDYGEKSPQQVSVLVPAGQSIQVTARQLEGFDRDDIPAGQIAGAWSIPAGSQAGLNGVKGKWRAVVTAEFPGLVASAYVRSMVGDILANITDSDTRGEQTHRDFEEGSISVKPGQRPSDYAQEFEPDFHGDGECDGPVGGPNDGTLPGTDTPICGSNPPGGTGGTTDADVPGPTAPQDQGDDYSGKSGNDGL